MNVQFTAFTLLLSANAISMAKVAEIQKQYDDACPLTYATCRRAEWSHAMLSRADLDLQAKETQRIFRTPSYCGGEEKKTGN